MSTLYEEMQSIERSYFATEVYPYAPQIYKSYKITDSLNRVFDGVSDAMVYDMTWGSGFNIKLCSRLNTENKRKVVGSLKDHKKIRYILKPFHQSISRCKTAQNIKMLLVCIVIPIIAKMFHLEVLDINKELEKNENLSGNWYDGLFDVTCIGKWIREYETASEDLLFDLGMKVFGGYFYCRDLKNAGIWADKCEEISTKQKQKKEINCIKNQINSALCRAKKDVLGKKHILVNWVDALRYDELSEMPFLEKTMKEGLFFDKMYAPTLYTNPELRSLLLGKLQIDDTSWKIKEEDIKKSSFYKSADKKGYKVAISSYKWSSVLADERCVNQSERGSSYISFITLCLMQELEKTIVLSHIGIYEVHNPHISPWITKGGVIEDYYGKEKYEWAKKQSKISKEYLDEQIEYWYEMMQPGLRNTIWLSDHGEDRGEDSFGIEGYHHTVFSITGEGINAERAQKVASLLRFKDAIHSLLNNESENLKDIMQADYSLIQNEDIYGTLFRYKKTNVDQRLQYRGVVTNEDTFVRVVNGNEYYFRGEEINLINDNRWQKRIEELRGITGNTFVDIYKHDRYRKTRKLYRKYRIKRSKKNKFI